MIETLIPLIREIAQSELMSRFGQMKRHFKEDGSIVTEADHTCQTKLQSALQQHWPEIALLGEEMTQEEQQSVLTHHQDGGLWILDPLDGTSNFAAGIPCFAISLALLRKGEIQLALIYDPINDECFHAIKGKGAWLNGEPLKAHQPPDQLSQCMAMVDFKRLSAKLAGSLAASPPYSSQRSYGSGVLDWCWLAAGRVHLYLHGGQKLWDIAAGQLILSEAGGYATTLEGEAVFQPALTHRSVVAGCNQPLFEKWSHHLKTIN